MQIIFDLNNRRPILVGNDISARGRMLHAFDGNERLYDFVNIYWCITEDSIASIEMNESCDYLILNIENQKLRSLFQGVLKEQLPKNIYFDDDYLEKYMKEFGNSAFLINKLLDLAEQWIIESNNGNKEAIENYHLEITALNLIVLTEIICSEMLGKSKTEIDSISGLVIAEFLKQRSRGLEFIKSTKTKY